MSKHLHDYDFPVDIVPLQAAGPDGTMIPVDTKVGRAVIRPDLGRVLSINGPNYRLTPYPDVVDHFMSQVTAALGSNTNVEIKDRLENDGAQFHRQIVINDLVIEPKVGDIVKLCLDLYDSYDMSWARQFNVKGMRLFCLNGCCAPAWRVDGYAKHTGDGNLERLSADKIGNAVEGFLQYGQRWQNWMQIPVSIRKSESLLAQTIAPATKEQFKKGERLNGKVVSDVMHHWREADGQNLWGFYNAMTGWASHFETRRNQNVSNIGRERMRKVAETINSPAFRTLEAA